MQLLVIQFTIQMFHLFEISYHLDIETCRSVIICEIIVLLLAIVQNRKMS